MGKPGIQFLILGVVLLIVGFLFQDGLASAGGDLLFYGVIVVGLAVAAFGVVQLTKGSGPGEADAEAPSPGHEALLKVLARGTRADTNIHDHEVEEVRRIYREATGQDVSAADVRVAALGEHYEGKPLRRYLASIEGRLDQSEKLQIAKALAAVIRADERVSPNETQFFNEVVSALKLSASDVADL